MKVLLIADIHFRGDAPLCRKHPEKWLEEQAQSFQQLYAIAKNVRDTWVLGDVFHRARTSTEGTVQALNLLSQWPGSLHVLAGNHDLWHHSSENIHKSTIGMIFSLKNVRELCSGTYTDCAMAGTTDPYESCVRVQAYPFGMEPEKIPSCDIWCTHQLVYPDEDSRPLIKDENGNPIKKGVLAEELLERSDARLILTGDYHHTFVKHFGDRTVMACGCLNIQARDMADYTPCCYILDTSDFSLEKIELKTFGEIDMNAPILAEAEDYAETIQLASLPRIDFRAAIEQAVAKAEPQVQARVANILEEYDVGQIV